MGGLVDVSSQHLSVLWGTLALLLCCRGHAEDCGLVAFGLEWGSTMGLLGWAVVLVVWMEDGGEGARKAASWVDTG